MRKRKQTHNMLGKRIRDKLYSEFRSQIHGSIFSTLISRFRMNIHDPIEWQLKGNLQEHLEERDLHAPIH